MIDCNHSDNLREPREHPDEFKTVVESFLPVLKRIAPKPKPEDEDASAE